jgi:hypothetical protein
MKDITELTFQQGDALKSVALKVHISSINN